MGLFRKKEKDESVQLGFTVEVDELIALLSQLKSENKEDADIKKVNFQLMAQKPAAGVDSVTIMVGERYVTLTKTVPAVPAVPETASVKSEEPTTTTAEP